MKTRRQRWQNLLNLRVEEKNIEPSKTHIGNLKSGQWSRKIKEIWTRWSRGPARTGRTQGRQVWMGWTVYKGILWRVITEKGKAFPFTSITAEVKALSDHEPRDGIYALMRISCRLMLLKWVKYLLSVLVDGSCSTNLSSVSPSSFSSHPFTLPCSHFHFWRKEEALNGLVGTKGYWTPREKKVHKNGSRRSRKTSWSSDHDHGLGSMCSGSN